MPYIAVSAADDNIANDPFLHGPADESSGSDDNCGRQSAPIFASLRAWGGSVKEKLRNSQVGDIVSSTRASTARASGACWSGSDDDPESGGRHRKSGMHTATAEEAQGLLSGGDAYGSDREGDEVQLKALKPGHSPPHSPAKPGRGAPMPSSPIDNGTEEDNEAMAALLKLRPAAGDSIGNDEEDDDASARPLVGTTRAGHLSR